MGIRETLNENRSVTVGATIGITVLAILWIIYYSLNGWGSQSGADSTPQPTTQSMPAPTTQ